MDEHGGEEDRSAVGERGAPALPHRQGRDIEGSAPYFHERLVGGEREADGADQEFQPRAREPGEQPDAAGQPDHDAGRQQEHVAQVPFSPEMRRRPQARPAAEHRDEAQRERGREREYEEGGDHQAHARPERAHEKPVAKRRREHEAPLDEGEIRHP